MADDSSQEKTEEPTPKRLREARKKGQVFHSKDLDAFAGLLVVFTMIVATKGFISDEIKGFMQAAFGITSKTDLALTDIYEFGKMAFLTTVKVSAPILIAAVATAAIVGYAQVGPLFSMDPLTPSMKKLNMIENLKNMAKPKTLFELVKNIVKLFVIFVIAYFVVKGMLEPFLMSAATDLQGAALVGQEVLVRFMIRFMILFLVIAIIDVMMQHRDYIKNLKMSKEEVKREYKEDEGDPHIKGHRRQLHMEMAMGDSRQQVKSADAVITNPTHLAIAIRYDKTDMMAPQVVAKGQRLYAEYIRDLAKEFDIPIIRNVPLAWALIEVEIGEEIPEKLYTAVAEILTFVYKMKQEGGAGQLTRPVVKDYGSSNFEST